MSSRSRRRDTPPVAADVRSTQAEVARACLAATDAIVLYQVVAAQIQQVVPCDRWCAALVDPATELTTGGYHRNIALPDALAARMLEIEVSGDVNSLGDLLRAPGGVSTLGRATGGHPDRSARYRDVLAPVGLGPEMRALLPDHGGVWGVFGLFRDSTSTDFSDRDLRFMAAVAPRIGKAVRRCLLMSEMEHRDSPSGPGIAVLQLAGPEVTIEVISRSCRAWLDQLVDDNLEPSGLPELVIMASQRARREGTAEVRLRTRFRRWVSIHAERLTASPTQGSEARVAIVVEPTRPHELAEVIAAAYCLTDREREVARLTVSGHGNRDIARILALSEWTVADHLKSVFGKIGVRSRAELTARMFFDQYAPRLGTAIGADGWFIT